MAETVIKKGARVVYSILDENCIVEENAVVGQEKSENAGISVLGREVKIAKGVSVAGGKILDKDYKGE